MSSLEDKLSGILSDPDAVSKLKSLGQALGLDTTSAPAQKQVPQSTGFSLPFMSQASGNEEMMSTLMRLAPLLADMGKDDEISCLLNSLRPFLSEHRRLRLDEAGKMLKVMRLLPIIRGSGLI